MQTTPPPDPHVPVQHVVPLLPQYPQPPTPPRRRSRTPLWVGLGAVVVLALAAVAGTMLRVAATPAPLAPAGVQATVSPWEPPPALDTPSPTEQAAPSGPVQVYEGTGDDVVQLREPVRLGILSFECGLCTSTASVVSDSGLNRYVVQHLSGGPYVGKRWVGVDGSTTTRFTVSAQGPWKLAVGGLDTARRVDGGTTVIGTGDDVVLMRTPPSVMHVSHTGASNFVVQLVTDHSPGAPQLIVNEIGRYTGTVPLDIVSGDAALVQVSADGDWTFIPA